LKKLFNKEKTNKEYLCIIKRNAFIVVCLISVKQNQPEIKKYELFDFDYKLDNFENIEIILNNLSPTLYKFQNCILILPDEQIEYQKINIPDMPDNDFKFALANQIENIEYFSWHSKLLYTCKDENNNPHKYMLISKAKKGIVSSYIALFDKFKINLINISNLSNILDGIMNKVQNQEALKHNLYIDLQESHLIIYIIFNNTLCYFRRIPYGFSEIVKALTRKIEVGEQKIDLNKDSMLKILSANDIFNAQKKESFPASHLFSYVRPIFEKMAIEIQKSIHFYQKTIGDDAAIAEAYLGGFFLKIFNCNNYFSEHFSFPLKSFEEILHENIDMDLTNDKKEIFNIGLRSVFNLESINNNNFLPKYYLQRPKRKKMFFILSYCLIIWILALAMLMLFYKKYDNKLDNEISKCKLKLNNITKEINSLKNSNKHFLKQKKIYDLIYSNKNHKLKLEDLFYKLNLLTPNSIQIESLSVKNDSITINGNIPKDNAQLVISKYIDKLELLEYLNEIVFEIKASNKNNKIFVVRAKIEK
jgi:Tfp pilus assembly PilM family ATPase